MIMLFNVIMLSATFLEKQSRGYNRLYYWSLIANVPPFERIILPQPTDTRFGHMTCFGQWNVSKSGRCPFWSFKVQWLIHHVSLFPSAIKPSVSEIEKSQCPSSISPGVKTTEQTYSQHTTDMWYKWQITFVIVSHQDFVVVTTA